MHSSSKAGSGKPTFPARLPSSNPQPSSLRLLNKPVLARTPPLTQAHAGLRGHAAARQRMVQRLSQLHGISDPAVLAAMFAVERHRFVDSALVGQAYEDTSLPIGFEQTISKPQIVARMLQLLQQAGLPPDAKVLEIGTGCGYQVAVLRQLFSKVYSIERISGLHTKAHANLLALHEAGALIDGIHLLLGDGMLGYAKGGPYHAIIAAAGGAALPQAWLEQLAPGGRIIAPIEQAKAGQALVMVDKDHGGQLQQKILDAVHFVPLKSGVR